MSTNKLKNEFKQNLQFFMAFRNETQTSLAKKMGVSKAFTNNLLKRNSSPTLDTIEKLSKALMVPPSLFLDVVLNEYFTGEEASQYKTFFESIDNMSKALKIFKNLQSQALKSKK